MKKETYVVPESEEIVVRFEENIMSTGGNQNETPGDEPGGDN